MAGHPAPSRASCTRQGILHQAGHPAPGRASSMGRAPLGIVLGDGGGCAVLRCAMLCCAVLCAVLCIVPRCVMLCCAAL